MATGNLNWMVTCRGGGHAVMDFYASLMPTPVQIEWAVALIEPSTMGFSHRNAMMRLSVSTQRNWAAPGPRAHWMNYEDMLDSPDRDPNWPTLYVVRSLPATVASRLKMQQMFNAATPRVDDEWYAVWADHARKVLNIPGGILYDKWFADQEYRISLTDSLNRLHLGMRYHEKALNAICNPRPEASSFEDAGMHNQMQKSGVLFRDEQFPMPALPPELIRLNDELLAHFNFDREAYRRP